MCLYFSGAPVVYRSGFQTTVSMSSSKAESISATKAGKFTVHLRSMLKDLGIDQPSTTLIHEDNAATIDMKNVSCSTRRTQHMDIKHFVLLDWVATYELLIEAISTYDNPADGLTKYLGPQLFTRHCVTVLSKRKHS